MTQTHEKAKVGQDPSRRLARRVMPFIAADSALLPPDSWIISSLRDAYKTVAPFRRDVRAVATLAGAVAGLVVTVAAGLAALAVIGTVTLVAVVGGIAVTAGGMALAAWRGARVWARAQADTLPAMKDEMARRYVTYKGEELMRAWRQRMEAQRAAKQAPPAADAQAAAPASLQPAGGLGRLFGRGFVRVSPGTARPVVKPPEPPKA